VRAIQCDHCRETWHDLVFNGVSWSNVVSQYGDVGEGHYCRSCWIMMQTLLRSSEA
jgi:hypothetical protein